MSFVYKNPILTRVRQVNKRYKRRLVRGQAVFEYNTRLGDADYVSYQSAEAAISCPNPQQDLAWFLAVGARPVDVDSTMLPYCFVSGEHTPAPVRPLANQPIVRPPLTCVQFTGEVTYQVRGGTVVRQPTPFYLSLTKSKQDAPLIDITASLISISGGNQFIDSVNNLIKSGRLTPPADQITVTPMGLVTDSVGGSDSKLKNYLVIPGSINNPDFVLNNFEFKATFVGSPNQFTVLLACGGDNLTTASPSNGFQINVTPTAFSLSITNFAQYIGGSILAYGVTPTWNTAINTVEIKRLGSVITFKINGTMIPASVLFTTGGGFPLSAPIGNFSGKPYLINGYDGYLGNNSPINNSLHGTPIVLKSMRLDKLP